MSTKYILELIAQGEHQQLDFKFAVNDSKKIARSLAAFANTDGGTLLLGVKDNGRIAGVNSEEEYYMIEAAAQLYCKPPVPFEVAYWEVDGKTVLEVKIAKSNQRPHTAPNKEGKATAYLRIADENVAADPILVKAWKSMASKREKKLAYTPKYDKLLDLLRNAHLTAEQLSRQAFLSQKETETIIVTFLAMGLVAIDCSVQPSRFSLVSK